MKTSVIKSDLHEIIEQLDDKKLLEKFYQEVMALASNSQKIWSNLSEAQKHEVEKTIEESKDESNLIDHEAVMKKYEKWL